MESSILKKCKKCNIYKQLSHYRSLKKSKDGLQYRCNQCFYDQYRKKRENESKNLQKFYEDNFQKAESRRLENKARKDFRQYNTNINVKRCNKCHEIKDLTLFCPGPLKHYKSGIKNICKKCTSSKASADNKQRKVKDIAFKLKCNLRGRITNLMNFYVKKGS